MRNLLRGLFVLALMVAVGVVYAEDKKVEDKKPEAAKVRPIFTFPKAIKLTEEQQKKLDALAKEYGPKLDEFDKKLATVMTPERQKIAAETRKKLQGEGKKGAELNKAVLEALKLDEKETELYKEVNKERNPVNKLINEKKQEILTPEQKEQLKKK